MAGNGVGDVRGEEDKFENQIQRLKIKNGRIKRFFFFFQKQYRHDTRNSAKYQLYKRNLRLILTTETRNNRYSKTNDDSGDGERKTGTSKIVFL